MRVEQQSTGVIDFIQQAGAASGDALPVNAKASAEKSRETGTVTVNMKDVTYGKPQAEEDNILEDMVQGTGMSAADRKNQMAVLSNTTSEEDYAKMQEEGFSLDSTSANTIVTVTDKIKAELAKAGVDISAFGDDLSLDELAEITGSPELAAQLAAAMRQADLPLTKDNQQEAAKAFMQAMTLKNPSDGAKKYLLDNDLMPTIANLYYAQNNSAGYIGGMPVETDSYRSQIEQVILRAGLDVDDTTLEESRWMISNDVPLTPENLVMLHRLNAAAVGDKAGDAAFLAGAVAEAVAEGKRPTDALLVPDYQLREQAAEACEVIAQATEEDLVYLTDRGLALTVANLREAQAVRRSGAAIPSVGDMARPANQTAGPGREPGGVPAQGQEPGGVLAESGGVAATAGDAASSADSAALQREGQNGVSAAQQREMNLITARRQLEEIRLTMTVEANYALLKRGMYLDTKPLEQLVEQLRSIENSYYEMLLRSADVEPTSDNTALFKETLTKVEGIKSVPAYVLGQKDIDSINAAHESGRQLKDTFERANERYETLMTAPRADMGDSIQKAFRNVDDILTDLSLETSEENRRAVRILAYNSLPVTQESVAQMKAADEEVQRVFKNMTPGVVIRMIRDGINPLDMDFRSVNTAAEQIKKEEGLSGEAERFSEYLWKLEKNQQISEAERSSYIGIYRLIHQIESSDGAAVGALVHQGQELTMKNLLTAVRSEKKSGKMDYAVDDAADGVESTGYQSSITDQIDAAYQMNCIKDVSEVLSPERMRDVLQKVKDWEEMTPEQLKQALSEAAGDEEEAAYLKEQLGRLEESARTSIDFYHVLEKYDVPNTVNYVLALKAMSGNRNRMFGQIFEQNDGESELADDKKALLEEFADAFSGEEAMERAQQKLEQLAESKTRQVMGQEHVTSLDLRQMRMMSAQLSLGRQMAKQEQYSVPVPVGDEIVNVSVKLKRDAGTTGKVDVMMESERYGKVAATFTAAQEGVDGMIAFERPEARELFAQQREALGQALTAEGETEASLHYVTVKDLDFAHFSMGAFGEKAENGLVNREDDAYRVQTGRLFHMAESFIRQLRTMER